MRLTSRVAVENFLADPALARRAGEEGRALTERAYNWPLLARQFVGFIERGRAAQPAYSHPESAAMRPDLASGKV
jgi:hypothetical protein